MYAGMYEITVENGKVELPERFEIEGKYVVRYIVDDKELQYIRISPCDTAKAVMAENEKVIEEGVFEGNTVELPEGFCEHVKGYGVVILGMNSELEIIRKDEFEKESDEITEDLWDLLKELDF